MTSLEAVNSQKIAALNSARSAYPWFKADGRTNSYTRDLFQELSEVLLADQEGLLNSEQYGGGRRYYPYGGFVLHLLEQDGILYCAVRNEPNDATPRKDLWCTAMKEFVAIVPEVGTFVPGAEDPENLETGTFIIPLVTPPPAIANDRPGD